MFDDDLPSNDAIERNCCFSCGADRDGCDQSKSTSHWQRSWNCLVANSYW